MTIDLSVLLPNLVNGLDGTGFIFGAGTSYEAGYKMMPALTQEVIGSLSPDERSTLDEVCAAAGESYDDATSTPNIEHLSDLVMAHWTNSGDPRFGIFEQRIRDLILENILAVDHPNIDNHCKFFEALKKRCFGLRCSVWIFTTNYDLLFEIAAARTGVQLENGFSGTTERYYNPVQFKSISGIRGSKQQFEPHKHLTVKLIKLHGSISWVEESSRFYERHPLALKGMGGRVLILPRRKKVMDTLTPPYDSLFTYASGVLGNECKYIVSCGFSFSDEHINERLFVPAVGGNKCRLFALSKEEPIGIEPLKAFPSFQAAFESSYYIDGKVATGATDVWKFSKFVELF